MNTPEKKIAKLTESNAMLQAEIEGYKITEKAHLEHINYLHSRLRAVTQLYVNQKISDGDAIDGGKMVADLLEKINMHKQEGAE